MSPLRGFRAVWAACAVLLLPLAGACSGGGEAQESGRAAAAVELPDPAEAGLVTPEEAAQAARETIDASNAEDELARLQREIGQG